jgi:hypothetical protein
MDFDISYNVRCVLRLTSGREVVLDKLSQSRTYAGLLEGTPNKRSNDHDIQWALDEARRDPASLGEPFLFEPERRDYLRAPGDMQSVLDSQGNRPSGFQHIPEWLPQIQCIGIFHSLRPVRDRTKHASSLTIVWYQDDFGIDASAIDRLRSVDWDHHAIDFEF